jgi:5-methylcytosine-specific restriction endonuclease McrA
VCNSVARVLPLQGRSREFNSLHTNHTTMTYTGQTKNDYQKAWLAKRRDEWFTTNGPCKICGSTIDLELDHIDRATKVSHRVWSWSEERRNKELAKCQALCNACHKDKTRIENLKSLDHGTRSLYRLGCRCNPCRASNAARIREYRKKQQGPIDYAG